jgi:prefoldin subunit 5
MDEATRRRADRDKHLAAHIQSATQSLREERDRLAKRLADLERELANLAARHDSPSAYVTSGDARRRRS